VRLPAPQPDRHDDPVARPAELRRVRGAVPLHRLGPLHVRGRHQLSPAGISPWQRPRRENAPALRTIPDTSPTALTAGLVTLADVNSREEPSGQGAPNRSALTTGPGGRSRVPWS